MSPEMRAFGPSTRSRLVLLVLVALVPMLLFSAVLLRRAYEVSAGLIEETTASTARRVAATVDAQVGRAETVGAVLAQLPDRVIDDLAAFEHAGAEAMIAAGLDGGLILIAHDGTIVADTLPAEGPLGKIEDRTTMLRVFETGQPQVSGVFLGRLMHETQIAIHVPVHRHGTVRYDAAVLLPTRTIESNLGQSGLPEGWFTMIADASGHMIQGGGRVGVDDGQPAPPNLAALFARQQGSGSIVSASDRRIFIGFVHSDRTGWTVSTGVPEWVVRGPLVRSFGFLAVGGAAILVISLGLAWVIGRNISRPLDALAREAARLGQNELPDPRAATGLAEAEAAAQALFEAGTQLQQRDVERETALREAEASQQRLLLAQEVGEIGTWDVDLINLRREWSPQQFALYGLPPGRPPPNRIWIGMLHPDDRADVTRTIKQALQSPSVYHHVFRILHPAGKIRWIRTAARSIFEDGKPARVIGISIDVTERHEAERNFRESAARLEAEVATRTAELAHSEERFRSYFDYSSDALVVVRVDPGRFVLETLNPAAERLFGLTHADIAERSPEQVYGKETADAALEGWREVVRTGRTLTMERTVEVPAGTYDVETILVPVLGPAGVIRIISANRDLTERKRIEGRLAHAQRLEAVGQLTGGVAHDFNNLLTVVIGNLALLRRKLEGDPSVLRYLSSVEAAAERGARLTASLLAFSRKQTLQVEASDIGGCIRDSVTLLRRALGEQIEFTLNIAPNVGLANADTAQLEAAVLNLVINARDALAGHASGRGAVCIRVYDADLRTEDLDGNMEAEPGHFIAVEVSDNGGGMPPAVRARAFEPFFTTKEVGRGTGLGLSQVFGFVRQLGGHVTLHSTPGDGTRVVMFLPAIAPTTEQAQLPAPAPSAMPSHATILVVEDDAPIRELTAEALRDAGMEVFTAANGPAALEVLRQPDRIDLLFSDIVMPGGSTGIELARQARELRPDLAVLLTSGYGADPNRRSDAAPEYEVLAKPYTQDELLIRIGQILMPVPAE